VNSDLTSTGFVLFPGFTTLVQVQGQGHRTGGKPAPVGASRPAAPRPMCVVYVPCLISLIDTNDDGSLFIRPNVCFACLFDLVSCLKFDIQVIRIRLHSLIGHRLHPGQAVVLRAACSLPLFIIRPSVDFI